MTDAGALRFVVVCEADGDRRTASTLADRVLPESVRFPADRSLDECRAWCGVDDATGFLGWAGVRTRAKELGLKHLHGKFGQESGELDAKAARRALLVIEKQRPDAAAVLLIRDSDGKPERRRGLEQARDYAQWPFKIVIGVAEVKRECWVLAAFQPADDQERARLNDLRQELGFDPCEQSERLTAQKEDAKKSAKRVLRQLSDNDARRAECGIEETDLSTLRNRGKNNGLALYLDEVRDRLAPLLAS